MFGNGVMIFIGLTITATVPKLTLQGQQTALILMIQSLLCVFKEAARLFAVSNIV
jgi:hypothetical protein